MPLVVVTEEDRVLVRWDGANVEGRWMPEVENWLAAHAPPPAPPEVVVPV